MQDWVNNGLLAAIIGALAFAALFLPGLVWQYRRFGRLSFARLLGLAAVCLYAAALLTYTLLPLPERSVEWCQLHARGMNLRPFAFIDDIREAAPGRSLRGLLTSFAVLQVAFNVVLFVPFGVILRRYFNRSVLVTTVLGAATSLLIELTQLTGLWFIYPCAFRAADVDDLMTNTLGTILGAVLAPVLLWWMPRAHQLAQDRLTPRPVTMWRRWIGMLIDAILMALVAGTTAVGLRVATLLFLGDASEEWTPLIAPAAIAVATIAVFVWPAWNHLAASVGQTVVWLTPKWRNADGTLHDGSRLRRVVRSLVVPASWLIPMFLAPFGTSSPFIWLLPLVVPLSLVMVPFTRTHRSLSGWLTGAQMVDIRTEETDKALPVH